MLDPALASWLEEQRGEGQLDSSGIFTLDARKSRDKLQAYRLADVEQATLSLVQAAVAAGAEELDIRLGAGGARLRGSGARPVGAEEILRGLQDPLALRGHRALGYLVNGLSGWMAREPDCAIVYRDCTEKGVQALELTAHGYALASSPPSAFRGISLDVQRSGGFWKRTFSGISRRVNDHRSLSQRCLFAPIPVRLDGQLVNRIPQGFNLPGRLEMYGGFLSPPNFHILERYTLARHWHEDLVGAPAPGGRPYLMLHDQAGMQRGPGNRVHLVETAGYVRSGPMVRCSSLLVLPGLRPSEALKVLVIKSGVSLDPVILEEGPGGWLALSGDDLSTDLSGLKAVSDAALQHRVQEALAGLPESLARLTRELSGNSAAYHGFLQGRFSGRLQLPRI